MISYSKAPKVSLSTKPGVTRLEQENNVNTHVNKSRQSDESSGERKAKEVFFEPQDELEKFADIVDAARPNDNVNDPYKKLDKIKAATKEYASMMLNKLNDFRKTSAKATVKDRQVAVDASINGAITDMNNVLQGDLHIRSLTQMSGLTKPFERLTSKLTNVIDHDERVLPLGDVLQNIATVTTSDNGELADMAEVPSASSEFNDMYHGEAQLMYAVPAPVTSSIIRRLAEAGVSERFLFDLGNYAQAQGGQSNGRTDLFGSIFNNANMANDQDNVHDYTSLFSNLILIDDTKELSVSQERV